jgi:hypothetical protein
MTSPFRQGEQQEMGLQQVLCCECVLPLRRAALRILGSLLCRQGGEGHVPRGPRAGAAQAAVRRWSHLRAQLRPRSTGHRHAERDQVLIHLDLDHVPLIGQNTLPFYFLQRVSYSA